MVDGKLTKPNFNSDLWRRVVDPRTAGHFVKKGSNGIKLPKKVPKPQQRPMQSSKKTEKFGSQNANSTCIDCCNVIITIIRKHQHAKTPYISRKNKKVSAGWTNSEFKLEVRKKGKIVKDITGYSLEREGPSSITAGSGKRIMPGSYKLLWHNWGGRGKLVPKLKDVPGRSYILIHSGNEPHDIIGCILPSFNKAINNNKGRFIGPTGPALNQIIKLLETCDKGLKKANEIIDNAIVIIQEDF